MLLRKENEQMIEEWVKTVIPAGMRLLKLALSSTDKPSFHAKFLHPAYLIEIVVEENGLEKAPCITIKTGILLLDEGADESKCEHIRDQFVFNLQQKIEEWAENHPSTRLKFLVKEAWEVVHLRTMSLQLSQNDKAIVECYIQGKSTEEIAVALGIPETIVTLSLVYFAQQ